MNKQAKYFLLFGALILLVGLFVGRSIIVNTPQLRGINTYDDTFSSATTNSSTTVSTAGSSVFSANYDRNYARIDNSSANTIWCSLGTTSSANHGIALYASGTLEFSRQTIPYTGAVHCTATVATTTIQIVEE